MGRIHLRTLSDYHKHGFDLEVFCRGCGHTVILTPDYFFARGELGRPEEIEKRLRCGKCKAKMARLSSTMSGPSGGRRRARSWQEAWKRED
jgi:hypothetical protein